MAEALTQKKLYPRRRSIRAILRFGIRTAMKVFADVEVEGKENLNQSGPLIVVANHFNFMDPVVVIHALPWPLEFIGGAQMPHAPQWLTFFPRIWGTFQVWRGEVSRDAIYMAQRILDENGILGVFPEGGSWAEQLRPARPGVGLLASSTRARILPIGLENTQYIFKPAEKGKRTVVKVRVGEPFGPFFHSERGLRDRQALDEIGHEIMRKIAALLPDSRRGIYSQMPEVQEAAREAAKFPWDPK